MLARGGTLIPWLVKPEGDLTWSDADWGRAATLEARWKMNGVSEQVRRQLIPCAVWMAKFPGMRFSDDIEKQLNVFMAEKIE